MHLDEVALNETLDSVLAPEQRAGVESHLAQCPDCAARLEGLRALVAGLETLPDTGLRRDLSLAVVTALRRQHPQNPAAAPALRTVLAVQALIALVLLALAWQVAARAPAWAVASQVGGEAVATVVEGFAGIASDLRAWQASAQQFVGASLDFVHQLPVPSLPVLDAGVCLAAVTVLWLLGNSLLLRRQPTSLPRSRL